MFLERLLFKLADVHCEHCQKKFKPEDFSAGTALLCSSCGHQMPIEMRSDNAAHINFDKSLVRPSDQVHLQREGAIFIVEKRWKTKYSRYLLAAAILWDLMWVSGLVAASVSGWLHSPDAWIVYAGITLPALIGLMLFYRALQELLNTTTIMIKNDKVVVGTAPISWHPVRIYRTDEIASFSIWKIIQEKGQSHLKFSFGVDLNTKDGRHEKICPASDVNEAIYIEKTIEELLHIEGNTSVDHEETAS